MLRATCLHDLCGQVNKNSKETNMADISLRGVKKKYGEVTAIHGIDLNVKSGEFIVFVGPSGCGKSTLMRMIAGLEDISEGDISIDQKIVNDLESRDRDIAMVFQDYALYPNKTVYENMEFGLKLRKTPAQEIKTRVSAAAEILQITHLLERLPKELSGGQRQRVAMGRAMVRQPKVFLFDEPLSNLDALLRNQVRAEIKKLHHRTKGTIIYVTHDQVEAMTLADRIVVLKAGRIVQVGTPDEIYHTPQHRFVAEFTGSPPMNLMSARVVNHQGQPQLQLKDGHIIPVPQPLQEAYRSLVGREVTFGIRPENLCLAEEAESDHWPVLTLTVDMVEPLGAENVVRFNYGQSELIGRFNNTVRPSVGEQLQIALNPEGFHLFDSKTEEVILINSENILLHDSEMLL
jgi:multiple sugar transport system ATP-binding protein